jgi:hypothetical protein
MCADEACFGLVASSFQFFTRLAAVFEEEVGDFVVLTSFA